MSFDLKIRVQHEQPKPPAVATAPTEPSPAETTPEPRPEVIVDHNNRLSRPGGARLAFYFTNSLAVFWVIGFLRARRFAAHQFLAENSHRLPTSDAGWYLYHRAKNYQVVWRGIKGGMKTGFTGAGMAFLYGFMEEFWDQDVRGGKVDAGGSLFAGTVTAGAFAMTKKVRRRQAWRYLRVGMGLGLMSGILQDLLRWSRGAPPWYFERLHEQRRKMQAGTSQLKGQ
jgi:hypothetical protein